ncbi:hypothetical protein, partial [Flavobacterium sp.]|uniref:hypothetical protein n=1 Tax=Flavobacterium sp. TaxID=239 RepID=UPI000EB8E552
MLKYFILITLVITNFTSFSQTINFKDKYFKNCVFKKYPEIDIDKNGEINQLEADKVSKLSLMELNIENSEDIKH